MRIRGPPPTKPSYRADAKEGSGIVSPKAPHPLRTVLRWVGGGGETPKGGNVTFESISGNACKLADFPHSHNSAKCSVCDEGRSGPAHGNVFERRATRRTKELLRMHRILEVFAAPKSAALLSATQCPSCKRLPHTTRLYQTVGKLVRGSVTDTGSGTWLAIHWRERRQPSRPAREPSMKAASRGAFRKRRTVCDQSVAVAKFQQ